MADSWRPESCDFVVPCLKIRVKHGLAPTWEVLPFLVNQTTMESIHFTATMNCTVGRLHFLELG